MDDEWFRYIQESIANQRAKIDAMSMSVPRWEDFWPEPDQHSVRFGTEEYMDKLWLQEIGIKS